VGLNEPIARMAYAEDQCTDRLWTGFLLLQNLLSNIYVGQRRLKSQVLLDKKSTDRLYGLRRFEPYSIQNGQDP
jgi:hypothetical protein